MNLANLEKYHTIVIQMHDNPDADAVGSGFSLYEFFKEKGKEVHLVYGGTNRIKKSNMRMLIEELDIPVKYMKDRQAMQEAGIGVPELLLTVDCQYGEGNVTMFDAQNVAIVDHHSTGKISDDMAEIRSHIVSCSTVCYDMLRAEGYDVNANRAVATALYYGMFMDSNEFSEIRHPIERDMIDFLKVDRKLIKKLVHSNFTMQELETAAIAMIRYSYDENRRLSIVKSKPCDPNILGLVGDMVLQVDSIDVCIIFNECNGGYKLSVRSCEAEVAANDLAAYLTEGIGNGGGHPDKAGGFIHEKRYKEEYDDTLIESYIFKRVEQYYDSFDVIYAGDRIDIGNRDSFALCRRKPCVYGYVKSTELVEKGTECMIRTCEGDMYVTAEEDQFLLIGIFGEVYPVRRENFEAGYVVEREAYDKSFEYEPSIRDLHRDRVFNLPSYAGKCRSKGGQALAKVLTKPTKLFSGWEEETYMYGEPGDYLCCGCEDEKELSIVKKDVFFKIYEMENGGGETEPL